MPWFKTSLTIQIVLAAYFQLVLWFPLGSWNDQPGTRLIALVAEGHGLAALVFSLALLLPVLLFAVGVWKRWMGLIWLGLIGYGTWAVLQIQSWWIPWIVGADERALNNQAFLQRTYKIFPSSPARPAPDGMHFVLDVLLFSAVIAIMVGLAKSRRDLRGVRP